MRVLWMTGTTSRQEVKMAKFYVDFRHQSPLTRSGYEVEQHIEM